MRENYRAGSGKAMTIGLCFAEAKHPARWDSF